MLLGGLGGAAAWVPAPAVAASVFPPERRGFATGLTSGGIGAGIVLAVILTTAVRAVGGDDDLWRPIWLIEAVVAVAAIVVAIAVLRPIRTVPGAAPRISVLRQVERWWSLTLAYVCFGLGYVLFATYVVAALEQDSGFGATHSARVFAFLGLGNAAGGFIVGPLSDRVGRRATMATCYFGASICALTVVHAGEPLVSVLTFLFGLSMAGAVVSIAAYLGDRVRPQDFGAAFGVITAAFGVAQAVGPRLGGAMADASGDFTGVFTLSAAAWAVGGGLALALPRVRS
jgi:predicted MFS family arabinose efflux permease